MKYKAKILVVGSLVMDFIVSANRFPSSGETVIGTNFSMAPGGKGANQALQAARLGAQVTMVGKVGNDDFGKKLIASLRDGDVDVSHIGLLDNVSTAIGNVQLQTDTKGTINRIIVVPGANMQITVEDVAFLSDEIAQYDMVMLQHEIPMEINCKVASYAKAAGVPVMLNPAPSAIIPEKLLSCLTYISPNEHEAKDIVGITPDDENGIKEVVALFHKMGVKNVLITLGKNGCIYSDGNEVIHSGSVDCGMVVDPTAAGDSFIGAFCTAVALGVNIDEALRFANCTAGITVSRMGAQTSLPKLNEVLEKMIKMGYDTSMYV